jgi:hypothetical protein
MPEERMAETKTVDHYMFGAVMFKVQKGGISGMNKDKFRNEADLVHSYDDTGQGCGLVRVYEDGSRVVLREAAKG